LLRFEDAWQHGERPVIEDHLPDDPARRVKVLVNLIHIDLERHLKAGEAKRVESYLDRYPDLANSTSMVVELIQAEFIHRRRREPTLTLTEYFQRFPEYQEQLQQFNADDSTGPPRCEPDSVEMVAGSPPGVATHTPARLGRYRITAQLGSGGFGVVYKGYDEDLHRDVAIKVPHRERFSKPEDAEAYLTEARVLASLDHPHIVPVYDVGSTEDRLCFVVSKFIEGNDLAKRMRETRFSFSESAQLVATVAAALQYAHQRRLVHRDVKPANILLDTSNKPYLADFGLALREEDFGSGAGVLPSGLSWFSANILTRFAALPKTNGGPPQCFCRALVTHPPGRHPRKKGAHSKLGDQSFDRPDRSSPSAPFSEQ
jgi:hypothetical protein